MQSDKSDNHDKLTYGLETPQFTAALKKKTKRVSNESIQTSTELEAHMDGQDQVQRTT